MSTKMLEIPKSLRATQPHREDVREFPKTPHALRLPSRDRRIQVVLMLLEENSHNRVDINEIAKVVNLSPGRLAHLFKNETGVALQQYLTQLRLAKAKRLLESTFLSVKEIAKSAGFPSVTRFSDAFKTLVGKTPAQYRKATAQIVTHRKEVRVAKSANR